MELHSGGDGTVTGSRAIDASRAATTLGDLRDANEQLVLSSLRTMREMEAALHALAAATRAARTDDLTSLPNHVLLRERFSSAVPGNGEEARMLAVLAVDLDDFTALNDTLGPRRADEILVHGADVIHGATRSCDTVSRRCCDEFVILLTDVESQEDVAVVARKLQRALGVPFSLDGGERVELTASVGVSLFPSDGRNLTDLVALANRAMQRAKRRGPGQLVFHGGENAEQPEDAPAAASSQDVEAASHADAVLREVNEKLIVAVLSAQELHARAEEGQKRQNELLAVVAHELRNPLGPIRNVSIALAAMEPADANISRLPGIIERQVQHMSRLIDDLLDVSRIATGKLVLDMKELSLDDVVMESVYAVRSAMTRRAQHLSIVSSAEPIHISGDQMRMVQVFTNLLDNASKYTPDDGEIELIVSADSDTASIVVRDNGIGIAPEALPRIFNLYQQEANAVGFNNAGLGIGLTVVRELVEGHGGTVRALNRPGGIGSEFIVTLPLSHLSRSASIPAAELVQG